MSDCGWVLEEEGYSQRNDHDRALIGTAWYVGHSWLWRVNWNGYLIKNGTGCIDRRDAQREADYFFEQCVSGAIDPPWKV